MLKIENLYLEIGKFKLGSINLTLGKESDLSFKIFRLIIGYEINLCIENNAAILTAERYNAIGEK